MTAQREVCQKLCETQRVLLPPANLRDASYLFAFIFGFWLTGTRSLRKMCGEIVFQLKKIHPVA